MAVTVLLELQAQPDKVDTLIQVFKEILPDTRSYEGCEGVEVIQNLDDPTNLVIIEKWQAKANHEKYAAWRAEKGGMEALGAMLTGAPTVKYFDTKDA